MQSLVMIVDTASDEDRYFLVGDQNYVLLVDREKHKVTPLWRRLIGLHQCIVAKGMRKEISSLAEMMNADPANALDILTEWKMERGYK